MISSAGTTFTIPAVVEDTEMPNHFFLGSHHHEAIGVRGAAVPHRAGGDVGLLYTVNRSPYDTYPGKTVPSQPRNLRKPLMFESRKPLKQYPMRMPFSGNNDEVSIYPSQSPVSVRFRLMYVRRFHFITYMF
jgi:hypothetical protein